MKAVTPQQARTYLAQKPDRESPSRPLTTVWPEATLSDAYRMQNEMIARRVDGGESVRGYAVAAASVAAQKKWGADGPCFGRVLRSAVHEPHRPLPTSNLISPRVAAGIAFVLGAPLRGSKVTVADAVDAVEHVMPTVDVLDSRSGEWNDSVIDAVADNARSAGTVLGSTTTAPQDVDLRLAGCLLHVNGDLAATGAGGVLMGSPWNALTWLVAELHEHGRGLDVGDLVLAGSTTPEVPVHPGDTVSAEVAGIGTVTVPFAA